MSATYNDTTINSSTLTFTTSFDSNRIKFAILLTAQLVSIPCFLYVFYQFFRKPQLRKSHRHHVIILLLVVSFLFVTVSFPMTEAYMFTSYVYPSTDTFCSLWTWIHYSLNIINLFLMAFASIERNWLIFYPKLVATKTRLILLHYLPLTFCILYPVCFYFAAIFIHQCSSDYDYTQLLCTWPCYFYSQIWSNIDLFSNDYAPLFSIPVFCTTIYIRVIIQKRAMKQQIFKWQRDKKMVLQLWAVSSLYLAMWMPLQLLSLINTYWLPDFLIQQQIDYIYLFPYFIHVLYPFVVLLSYSETMLQPQFNQMTVTVYPTVQLIESRAY